MPTKLPRTIRASLDVIETAHANIDEASDFVNQAELDELATKLETLGDAAVEAAEEAAGEDDEDSDSDDEG